MSVKSVFTEPGCVEQKSRVLKYKASMMKPSESIVLEACILDNHSQLVYLPRICKTKLENTEQNLERCSTIAERGVVVCISQGFLSAGAD